MRVPYMYDQYDAMQIRLKAKDREIESFKSGKKYIQMKKAYESAMHSYEKEIRELKKELADANARIVSIREEAIEDYEALKKEHKKKMTEKQKECDKWEAKYYEMARKYDALQSEKTEQKRALKGEIYKVATELEEEKEKNQKLMAQVNKDFENSSIPSSMVIGRKKITNSREKTDRKPGAQPRHNAHTRQMLQPTESHEITASKYENNPDYEDTGDVIRKQLVDIQFLLSVKELYTKIYKNKKTGKLVHAAFPAGYKDDVNYGSDLKSFLMLLTDECNVSIEKTRRLVHDITEGKLNISAGMIDHIRGEFSDKSKPERKANLGKIMNSPVLNIDFTNANVNGESKQVFVVGSPSSNVAMYFAREHKGHEGIKGTPIERYVGTLVHDHDKTFYYYGLYHQECIQHMLRYLLGCSEVERDYKWHSLMRTLFREMIAYRNEAIKQGRFDEEKVKNFESRYDEIVEIGRKEYEDLPPSQYYKDGYNLWLRMCNDKKHHLLFLYDMNVPPTNNFAERLARVYKRKQKQIMAWRSYENFEYACNNLGTLHSLRLNSDNLFRDIASIFERPRPRKPRNLKYDSEKPKTA